VVFSTAVSSEHAELSAARGRGVPVMSRGTMLAQLVRLYSGIAVAGAHGKTTTTSMIAFALERCGLDPTAAIGGRLSAFGSNARLGRGRHIVVEADESDGSFLELSPDIAVITNLDDEHLERYESFGALREAFVQFGQRVPASGCVVACLDDPHVRGLVPRLGRRTRTYGVDASDADVRAADLALSPNSSSCAVECTGRAGSARARLTLAVPGRHNVQNALAALAVGLELGLGLDRLAAVLGEFRGADRRFQVWGTVRGVTVVDDYGHHPTEIAAVLATARLRAPRRLIVVFQPHRYTRTARLLDAFGRVLAGADGVVLTEVYGAGEPPLPGATAEAVARAIRAVRDVPVEIVSSLGAAAAAAARLAGAGDLVVTLGAGSIGGVPSQILDALGRPASTVHEG